MIEHLATPNIFHKLYQKKCPRKNVNYSYQHKNMFRHSSLANIWQNKNKKDKRITNRGKHFNFG